MPRRGRALEIGCGTGQATRPLAARGYTMVCLEPGPAMAQLARARLAEFPAVEVRETSFEAWPLEPEGFDLIVSAQAFHWVAPEVRFAKTAAALRAGGSLAVIGNAVVLERTPVRAALDAAYARHAPGLVGPPVTRWYAEEGPIAALVHESGLFGAVAARCYPWSRRYSAADYCDLLRTHSDHRMLPAEPREALLGEVARVIGAHGGALDVPHEAWLYVAARL